MAHRFCPRCNAEVEDAGGYCLLGHDLRLEAPVDSLKALRAEVNRTFDEARKELAHVMAPAAVLAPELTNDVTDSAAAPEPQQSAPRAVRLDEALVVEGEADAREWADAPFDEALTGEAVSAGVRASTSAAANGSVWEGLDEEKALSPGDPIATFAPSPRMDWGPARSRLLGRRSHDEHPADA